eukprot:scaffold76063_cov45-Phaeocystis_antarctica.AAC.1
MGGSLPEPLRQYYLLSNCSPARTPLPWTGHAALRQPHISRAHLPRTSPRISPVGALAPAHCLTTPDTAPHSPHTAPNTAPHAAAPYQSVRTTDHECDSSPLSRYWLGQAMRRPRAGAPVRVAPAIRDSRRRPFASAPRP